MYFVILCDLANYLSLFTVCQLDVLCSSNKREYETKTMKSESPGQHKLCSGLVVYMRTFRPHSRQFDSFLKVTKAQQNVWYYTIRYILRLCNPVVPKVGASVT